MAKLSDKERKLLEQLSAKAEAPDEPPIGRSVTASVDLGDPAQVALAVKHGFLSADEVEELKDGDDGDGEGDGDDTPKRRGYFKDSE